MRLTTIFLRRGRGALSGNGRAQTFKEVPAPLVSDTLRELLARDSKHLVASADLMPAEKYGGHTLAS